MNTPTELDQSDQSASAPEPEAGLRPVRKSTRKRNLIIGAAAGGALLLLGGTAAVAAPALIHQLQVAEYHQHVDALVDAEQQLTSAEADHLSAIALVEAQHTEAVEFAERLVGYGAVAEPTLTQQHATDLAQAGEAVLDVLGESTADDPARQPVVSAFAEELEVLAEIHASAAEDEELAAELDVPPIPASFLEAGVADVRAIAFEPVSFTSRNKYADDQVTGIIVEGMRDMVSDAQQRLSAKQAEVDVELERSAEILDAITGTLPALAAASEAAPVQAAAVSLAADQAGAEVLTALTKGAELAKRTAQADAASAVAVEADLAAYVQAAQSAASAHSAAVAAAEAAAAAAASGAGGYVDPSTGSWTPVSGGGAGGWSNGGGSGGGGGWSGGGGSSGGTGGGGGGWDPNYVPNGGACPAQPPGWYPTGGTANGCPTYNPPGGDADSW